MVAVVPFTLLAVLVTGDLSLNSTGTVEIAMVPKTSVVGMAVAVGVPMKAVVVTEAAVVVTEAAAVVVDAAFIIDAGRNESFLY